MGILDSLNSIVAGLQNYRAGLKDTRDEFDYLSDPRNYTMSPGIGTVLAEKALRGRSDSVADFLAENFNKPKTIEDMAYDFGTPAAPLMKASLIKTLPTGQKVIDRLYHGAVNKNAFPAYDVVDSILGGWVAGGPNYITKDPIPEVAAKLADWMSTSTNPVETAKRFFDTVELHPRLKEAGRTGVLDLSDARNAVLKGEVGEAAEEEAIDVLNSILSKGLLPANRTGNVHYDGTLFKDSVYFARDPAVAAGFANHAYSPDAVPANIGLDDFVRKFSRGRYDLRGLQGAIYDFVDWTGIRSAVSPRYSELFPYDTSLDAIRDEVAAQLRNMAADAPERAVLEQQLDSIIREINMKRYAADKQLVTNTHRVLTDTADSFYNRLFKKELSPSTKLRLPPGANEPTGYVFEVRDIPTTDLLIPNLEAMKASLIPDEDGVRKLVRQIYNTGVPWMEAKKQAASTIDWMDSFLPEERMLRSVLRELESASPEAAKEVASGARSIGRLAYAGAIPPEKIRAVPADELEDVREALLADMLQEIIRYKKAGLPIPKYLGGTGPNP